MWINPFRTIFLNFYPFFYCLLEKLSSYRGYYLYLPLIKRFFVDKKIFFVIFFFTFSVFFFKYAQWIICNGLVDKKKFFHPYLRQQHKHDQILSFFSPGLFDALTLFLLFFRFHWIFYSWKKKQNSNLNFKIYCSSSPNSCLIFEKSNSSPVPRLKMSKTSKQVVSKWVVASYDSEMKTCVSSPLSVGS